MSILKRNFMLSAMAVLAISLASCKTKKLATQPAPTPPVAAVEEEKPAPPPAPEPKKEEPAPAPVMPSFNYKNIQFEFDSAVLKTASYSVLDQIAMEMKKYPDVKFNLEGHSSAEGTPEHNMSLSLDRANAVKAYLVNYGVNADNLTTKGFGESRPISANDDEAGRALNRRVEIKKAD